MSPDTIILNEATPLLHYKWGNPSEGLTLVDNKNLAVKLEQIPPGVFEEWHFHADTPQYLHVLQGEALIDTGRERMVVRRSHGLMIAQGKAHRLRNVGNEPLKFMLCAQPHPTDERTDVNIRFA